MDELISKLESYNIFNYLVPGVLFAVIGSHLTAFPFLLDDVVVGIFVYYFYGLIISRIGSLVIFPVLKLVRFIKYAPYADFVRASQIDAKINVLSESNNMFRTLLSLFICLIILRVLGAFKDDLAVISGHYLLVSVVALAALFLFAYRKQTNYVKSRVEQALKSEKKGLVGGDDGSQDL